MCAPSETAARALCKLSGVLATDIRTYVHSRFGSWTDDFLVTGADTGGGSTAERNARLVQVVV